jgi:hypothetical protein
MPHVPFLSPEGQYPENEPATPRIGGTLLPDFRGPANPDPPKASVRGAGTLRRRETGLRGLNGRQDQNPRRSRDWSLRCQSRSTRTEVSR